MRGSNWALHAAEAPACARRREARPREGCAASTPGEAPGGPVHRAPPPPWLELWTVRVPCTPETHTEGQETINTRPGSLHVDLMDLLTYLDELPYEYGGYSTVLLFGSKTSASRPRQFAWACALAPWIARQRAAHRPYAPRKLSCSFSGQKSQKLSQPPAHHGVHPRQRWCVGSQRALAPSANASQCPGHPSPEEALEPQGGGTADQDVQVERAGLGRASPAPRHRPHHQAGGGQGHRPWAAAAREACCWRPHLARSGPAAGGQEQEAQGGS